MVRAPRPAAAERRAGRRPAGRYHAVMETPDAVERTYAFLRRHFGGELKFDERIGPVRYVIGHDGRPAGPVEPAMLEAVDTVLFVPQFAEGALEVSVTLEAFDPDGPLGALADRWRIYHGDPVHGLWAILNVEAARFEGQVIDGPALTRPNTLGADEPAICREVNRSRRSDLRPLCRRFAEADVEDPLLVGVDPAGFDVRRRFDVVRVPAPRPVSTAAEARALIASMMAEASASTGAGTARGG